MLDIFTELKLKKIFYDIDTYKIFKEFGFNSIKDLIDVDIIICPINKSVKLRKLEMAFRRVLNAGIELEKLGIFKERDIVNIFNSMKKCKNCGKYYVYSKETDFCPICESIYSLSLTYNRCYMYYSIEKKAIVVRNCSSQIMDFNLNINDAYLVINNREENLVENNCIFKFQSGILPRSERVFIDLSDYNNDEIQSIVVVLGGDYYEFTRESYDENLFLKRLVDSTYGIEASFYNTDREYIKGEFRNCEVDLFPLVKNEYYNLQEWFNNIEKQDVINQYKTAILNCSLAELAIAKKSLATKMDYSKITLTEFLQYRYEDLEKDFAREDLIEMVLGSVKKFSMSNKIINIDNMSDAVPKQIIINRNRLILLELSADERILFEDISEKRIREIQFDYLDFSMQTYNLLKRARIDTIGKLLNISEYELRQLGNMGRKNMQEIKSLLNAIGYSLNKKETMQYYIDKINSYSKEKKTNIFSKEELLDLIGRNGIHSLIKWDVLEEENGLYKI